FAAAETRLQEAVERGLVQKVTAGLVELTKTRLGGFWSGQEPGIKTRWEVVHAAGRVLLAAAHIDSALKGKQWPAEALVARYAYGDEANEPWCLLDTAQRHLERDFHRFELDPQLHGSLLQLVSHARQQYTETTGTLTGRFIRAYQEAKFELPS